MSIVDVSVAMNFGPCETSSECFQRNTYSCTNCSELQSSLRGYVFSTIITITATKMRDHVFQTFLILSSLLIHLFTGKLLLREQHSFKHRALTLSLCVLQTNQ
jgi:hypothetical protein